MKIKTNNKLIIIKILIIILHYKTRKKSKYFKVVGRKVQEVILHCSQAIIIVIKNYLWVISQPNLIPRIYQAV